MHMNVEAGACAAPCLSSGPLMASGNALVAVARRLGSGPRATAARVGSVPFLFQGLERVIASTAPPEPSIIELLNAVTDALRATASEAAPPEPAASPAPARDVAEVTGEHYGRLFREFSSTSFWSEPAALLRQRLERNNVDPESWRGKRVLDAGCGGGRYTVAWRLLGAGEVVGVDVSSEGLADAAERVAAARVGRVTFETGNVLQLPFDDNSFDVVFSNGVLHHTVDWVAGVSELVRVLRPGGFGWLYLIENPGGLFWDVIEILRDVMRDDDRDEARDTLQRMGIPANRIFYMLDHVMVPINVRLTPGEIESALKTCGATGIRRLTRGADFDRVEAIHRGIPFAAQKYGVGENRYMFSRA